uniref:myosin-11-like n=1 Tax=Gasterosteus aculeatus aculeatus TaxID=481459 RepID=UPI001A997169|nr:myosin-11-like [Gasterosteus aculeatus aculeatus]
MEKMIEENGRALDRLSAEIKTLAKNMIECMQDQDEPDEIQQLLHSREKAAWKEELEKVSQALKEAEEKLEDLQEEVSSLWSQLYQEREQATLLAGAEAAWNREKEICAVQGRSEQVFRGKLREELKKLEQPREDEKEQLRQMEAKRPQMLGAREELSACGELRRLEEG